MKDHMPHSLSPFKHKALQRLGAVFQSKIESLQTLLKFPSHIFNTEVAKLIWIVRLRWAALILFLILTAPALRYGYLDRSTIVSYLACIGVLLFFNLSSVFLFTEQKRKVNPLTICFQLGADLIILTCLLGLTKGIFNPFLALFFLNASLGGILIPGRLALPFLILTHTLLGLLQVKYLMSLQASPTQIFYGIVIVSHLLVFAFWVIMRNLGSYLERKNKDQAHATLLLERQDRLRSIGALAAGFSHEFASPLNTAKLRLQRLFRQKSLAEDLKEDLSEALSAIHECENIILQMNSSQLDSRDFKYKEVPASELLTDIVDSWKDENPDAIIVLNAKTKALAHLPPINFAQVVLNLLDNAYEAAASKPIQIDLFVKDENFHLEISDQGEGFADVVLDKQIEPFITTKVHGTGLGLYVSQLFANSLGGQLKARNLSHPTSGAQVQIIWPQRKEVIYE